MRRICGGAQLYFHEWLNSILGVKAYVHETRLFQSEYPVKRSLHVCPSILYTYWGAEHSFSLGKCSRGMQPARGNAGLQT